MSELTRKHCKSPTTGLVVLAPGQLDSLLKEVPEWSVKAAQLVRTYRFENYHDTLAFVNASALVSHRENHHPDLTISYGECNVRYSTHDVNGLSENDFICAAKLDALFGL